MLFDDQCFRGTGAGNPFVKGAGDLGIDPAGLSVPMEDFILKVDGQQCDDRDDEHNQKRQLPV